jgi:hypothetical protein
MCRLARRERGADDGAHSRNATIQVPAGPVRAGASAFDQQILKVVELGQAGDAQTRRALHDGK